MRSLTTSRRRRHAAAVAVAAVAAVLPMAVPSSVAAAALGAGALTGVAWGDVAEAAEPAPSGTAEQAARDALLGAASGAEGAQYAQARDDAVSNQWYDTCEDVENGPFQPRVDLRSTFIVQTTTGGEDDQTGFLAYACRPWGAADLGRGGITWGLDVDDDEGANAVPPFEGDEGEPVQPGESYPTQPGQQESGPDFVVTIYPEADGTFRIAAVRTPDFTDRSTWYLTWLANAQRLDGFEIDGVVPTKAIGGTNEFELVWAVTDADGRTDVFPEDYMRLGDAYDNPRFPNTCTGLSEQRLVASTRPGEADAVAERARAEGLAVTNVLPRLDAVGFAAEEDGDAARAAAIEGVVAVRPTGLLQPQQVVPDDPGYPAQWAPERIGLPSAWGTISASGILVAIIDSGIDGTWPDLAGRVEPGLDVRYAFPLPAGSYSDRDPHGTAVAGILGAAGNDGAGIAGVDWGARLLPLRALDVNQCYYDTVVAAAILEAVDRGARIINVSLGAAEDFQLVRDAVDFAQERDVLVVAPAGNLALDGNPTVYPAAYPGVIAVGATTRGNVRAGYSGTGRWVDVVAPGGNGATAPNGTFTAEDNLLTLWELDRLRPVAGTSYAAPMVAGAAALYFGLHPAAVPDDIRIALEGSSRDLGQFGHDAATGYGLLDVPAMLAVPPTGGPVADPSTGQLPRVNQRLTAEIAEFVSRSRFADGAADHAVVARHDLFVDALAGAPLTAEGPLLLADRTGLSQGSLAELERALGGRGTVYVLGGEEALGPELQSDLALRGHQVIRLAGPTRVETALAVGEEVRRLHPGTATVALARADEWADAVTGGAWAAEAGVPLLVTGGEALHPAVAERLSTWSTDRTVLLGGTAALGEAVAAASPGAERVAGDDRAGTAAAVAERLWDGTTGYVVVNGWRADAWGPALAAAGMAADRDAPMLVTDRSAVPPATTSVLATTCPAPASLVLVGDDTYVGGSAEAAITEASTCS